MIVSPNFSYTKTQEPILITCRGGFNIVEMKPPSLVHEPVGELVVVALPHFVLQNTTLFQTVATVEFGCLAHLRQKAIQCNYTGKANALEKIPGFHH